MSDTIVDPRFVICPTLDDLLYRVKKLLCREGEPEGDAIHRHVCDGGVSLQSIADTLEVPLARVRYLMIYCGVGTPIKRSRKVLAGEVVTLAGYGYESYDIAKQLGCPHGDVLRVIDEFRLDVQVTK